MNTEKLMKAIASARKRADVVPAYIQAIRIGSAELHPVHWPTVNEAIISRWSMAALKWIKARAWEVVEAKQS